MKAFTKGAAVITATALLTGGAVATAAHADAGTTTTIRSLDLSQTRANGHVDFLTDGLHVYTDDASSLAKAAGYFEVTGALPESASLTWFGTQPQPGQQIVFDADDTTGNGNDYNILVGEPVYGQNWWLTNGSSADAKAADPSGADNGGNGSDYFGTLAAWKAALPDARILAGGFSLGSGVKGDGVVDSITYGSTTYRFTNKAETPAPVVTDVTGHSTKKIVVGAAWLKFYSDAQPANTVIGKKLSWKVVVDGKRVFSTNQGFDDRDSLALRFPKHSGKHVVDVFKNGVQVGHFTVRSA